MNTGKNQSTNRVILVLFAVIAISVVALYLIRSGTRQEVPTAAAAPPSPPASQDADVLELGAADHTQCALKREFPNANPTPAELAKELGADSAEAIPAITRALPEGARIISAHRCTVNKHEYLHIIIRKNAALVSLSVTLKNGESFGKGGNAAAIRNTDLSLHEGKSGDIEVAGFETDKHLAFISSSLPEDEHFRFSKIIGPALRALIVRIES